MIDSSSLPPTLSQPKPLSALQQASQILQGSQKNDSREKFDYPGVPLFEMPSSENDPYLFAEQVLNHYQSLFDIEPDPSSQDVFRVNLSEAGDIEYQSRQLHRELRQNTDKMASVKKDMKTAVAEYLKVPGRTGLARGAPATDDGSHGSPPHIDALNKLIGIIHDGYQDVYSKIIQAASEFMKEFDAAIGTMSDSIDPGDNGQVRFTIKEFGRALEAAMAPYTTFPTVPDKSESEFERWSDNDNYTKPIFTFEGDKAALRFWENKLGSGFIVRRDGFGKIHIYPNLAPIRDIFKRLCKSSPAWNPSDPKGDDMSAAAFQALQAAIDSDKSTVNNGVSQLLEKFRQDNSTFETLLQLLTKLTEDLHRYNAGYFQ